MDETKLKAAKKRMDRCMFHMFREFPFWAFLIEKCDIKLTEDSKTVPTAAVTKDGTIYFNTEFFDGLSESMVHFVLAHEVMHLVLEHHQRRAARDPLMWNVAGDVLINEMLSQHFSCHRISLDLSAFCTVDSTGVDIDPDNTTTEQVYDKLMANAPKVRMQIQAVLGEDGQGPCDIMFDSSGSSDGAGDPDGGVDGNTIRDKSESTPQNEREWGEAALESATRSKIAGKCPQFMERRIDKMLNPEIPWSEVLAYYLRQKFCQNSKSRHTFTPPNRRYLHQDVIMTSRVGAKKPSIAFSIDTSGSMSRDDITKGVSEMDAIRKLYKVPVYLMEADYSVHKAQWVSPHEDIPALTGGGGTSFVPVIEHLKQNKPDVDLLVYFTDGYGDFGPPPDFDVLWVINSDVVAPYGKTIKVSRF